MKSMNETLLMDREKAILQAVQGTIKALLPDATVILFGSRARGDAAADADWDILVLTATADWKTEKRVWSALYDIELDENIILNVLVIERVEWEYKLFDGHPLKRNVEKEGVLVA